jgi:hypothetical protein
MHTVVVALMSAVVLGALFLLWQVRTFIGWFVVALFLAVGSILRSTGSSGATG